MILETVAKILADYKDCDTATITKDTTFADLQLDSLDTVEVVMSLEEKFDITIESSEGLKTVGDIVALIEKAKA